MSSQEIQGLPSRLAGSSWTSEARSSNATESAGKEAESVLQTEHKSGTCDPPRSIAQANDRLRGVIKEDASNLETWDALRYHWRKLLSAFANWNNRQILKDINASPQVLRTYHDSFLFGEVPLSVKTRTTLRAGPIGIAWILVSCTFTSISTMPERMPTVPRWLHLSKVDLQPKCKTTNRIDFFGLLCQPFVHSVIHSYDFIKLTEALAILGKVLGKFTTKLLRTVLSSSFLSYFTIVCGLNSGVTGFSRSYRQGVITVLAFMIGLWPWAISFSAIHGCFQRPWAYALIGVHIRVPKMFALSKKLLIKQLDYAGVLEQMEFVLALLSGVLYVYSTYKDEAGHNWAFQVQNAISIAFIADYIFRVYSEPVRFYFIFSIWGLIDLLSLIPVILIFKHNVRKGSIIRLFQFLRVVRIFSLTNKVGLLGSSVTQQICLLTIATFSVVFLDAGILHWVEYYSAPPAERAKCPEQGCVTFWEALYFLIVTIATVGYGDVTPKTILGQFVAIISIVTALTILPIQIGRITSLAYRRPYGGSFTSRNIIGTRFLIISGSITFAAVQNFLAEFYNPTHCEGGSRLHYIGVIEKRQVDLIVNLPDLEVYPLRVIILAPFAPSFELKQVISFYNGLVEFVEGSPVRHSDLERVSADRATAFFLLADNDAEDIKVEDAAQVVRALAVHRFCRGNRYQSKVRIILEVLDPDTHGSAVWDDTHRRGIEVICPIKVHYKMMARSCAVHGLYTLITNLFTSELQLKYMFNSKHFLTEYFHSFDNEVYPVLLPQAFHNRSFEEVAESILVNFSSTLFAVDTAVGTDRKVLLYPKGHRIHSDDVGIVIASSLHIAYAISTYAPDEKRVGLLTKLWLRATKRLTIKRDNLGIKLRDPFSGRWRRNYSMRRSTGPGLRNSALGRPGTYFYPRNTYGNLRLEHNLRSAIKKVYHATTAEVEILRGLDVEASELEEEAYAITEKVESKAESGHHYPKGMSLEKAAEDLLAWPPNAYGERPHPAVIQEKQDLILQHLRENTITIVAFDTPHILVCCQGGWPNHFFYFLLEVRKPGWPNPPIVILHPRDLTAQQWGSVGSFPDVFFLKGSPIYELDLLRGGVLQAEKIVILSDQGKPVDLRVGKVNKKKYLKKTPAAYTSDIENIVVAANVQRLFGHQPNENVIVEMQHPEGFYYLRPQYEIAPAHFLKTNLKRNRDSLVHFGPPFMEGKAVSCSMLGFLMRSSFYNRNTLSIVEQLIHGGHVKTEQGLKTEDQRVLDQVVLPEQYANRPYSELFLGLLRENGVLAIGLYRARGTLGAPTAYVLTNPQQDCIVNPGDLVYILN